MMSDQLEAQLVADTSQYTTAINQAAALTDQQMKRIAGFVKSANDQQAAMGRQAAANAETMKSSYDEVTSATERMASGHAGVTRELLVLAHEMSQGNFKRFGGSMLVLAERTNALEFAMTAAGAATLGAGIALIGTLALIAKGAIDANEFAKALQLTGNYAGTSADQLTRMASAQSRATGQTVGGSRSSLEAVAGSGLFGPQALAVASRAMGDYQKATGKTAEEALANFDKITQGVAKWADEQNRSVHFLTASEYEHIKALEDGGNAQAAATEALKLYAETIESRATPAVGRLAQSWEFLKGVVTSTIAAIENAGRPQSLGDQIDAADRQIALMREASNFPGKVKPFTFGAVPPGTDANINAALENRRMLANQQAMQNANTQAVSERAAAQSRGVDAQKYLDQLHQEEATRDRLNTKLQEYHRNVAALAAAGVTVSKAQQALDEKEIRQKFAPKLDGKIVAPPNSAQEQFRSEELAKNEATILALREAGLKTLEDENALYAKAVVLETPQVDFRRAELDAEEQVTKAMNEQLLAQEKLNHEAAQQQDFAVGIQKAIDGFKAHAADAAGFAQKAVEDAAGAMTDALTRFAETGRLSFKGLIDAMISDLIRMQVESGFAALFGGHGSGGASGGGGGAGGAPGGGSIFGTLLQSLGLARDIGGLGGAFFAANTGLATGVANALPGDALDNLIGITGGFGTVPALANGLDYVPYDNFPALLHEGERVTRRQDAATDRSSRAIHVDNSVTIGQVGSNVSRADMNAAVQQGQAQSESRMRRLLKNGSLVNGS